MKCTETIFGKPLSEMTKANADIARINKASLNCNCADCVSFRERNAILFNGYERKCK